MAERGVTRLLAVNPANARHVVGKIALHDLLKARARHLEDEQRRERDPAVRVPAAAVAAAGRGRCAVGVPGER